jgi:hypothetical protein
MHNAGWISCQGIECEFELPEAKEEEEDHLRKRDALYGMRTEAMRLHYRVNDG